jgi:hypothetical protein
MSAESLEKLQKFLDQSFLSWIGLVVALFVMAGLVQWTRSWFRGSADPADCKDQILTRMEELRREGDLTEEEFRSIQGQLTGRSKS